MFEPVYEASAWLQFEERTPYLAFENKDDGRSKLFFQTQIEIIRSPLVLGPVVKRPEIAQSPKIAAQTDKVSWLAKQIRVTSVGNSELFRILYADPDPKIAAGVVGAVTESYFKLRDQTDAERNQRIIDLLGQEKDRRLREVLRLRDNVRALAQEAAVKDPFAAKMEPAAAQKHPLADLESRLIEVQVEGTVLKARIKAAEEELKAKEEQWAAASGEADQLLTKQELALRDVLADRIVEESPEVRQQKDIIAAKMANLKETERLVAKGRQSPVYARLLGDIRNDERTLDRLRNEIKQRAVREAELSLLAKRTEQGTSLLQKKMDELAKMRSDLAACAVMETMLLERYEKQRKDVEASSGDTLELGFKYDELVRAEKVFEMIAQRAVELQTERGAPGRVRLMQGATPPSAPVEAFPLKLMAIVCMGGLCLPFALAVLWERLVGRVGDSAALESQSRLAVLGEIARLPMRSPIGHRSSSERVKHDLRLFEESIDSLRTSLSLSESLGGMRVLAVTSAANREGKTSVASQLAVSFARSTGKQLLLIDGDMRCPDLHNVFNIELEPGLVKVLDGGCELEDAINTGWSDLVHVLPAGRLEVNPHTLLGNGTWTSLLSRIPEKYRYVIIDTPPVLSASEALVLTKEADATLVCVMRDYSRVDQFRKILERLETAGTRPVGIVLNGVPVKDYSYRWGEYSYVRD
ncbi:MAG: polysaccharide biosynthesis tyrosine autokinase [Pirellulaceae bacterium]|nr:polysaccharide biosynthesis tyrosine autokinase [Pirellulaceae bacterium]